MRVMRCHSDIRKFSRGIFCILCCLCNNVILIASTARLQTRKRTTPDYRWKNHNEAKLFNKNLHLRITGYSNISFSLFIVRHVCLQADGMYNS